MKFALYVPRAMIPYDGCQAPALRLMTRNLQTFKQAWGNRQPWVSPLKIE